MPRVRRSGRVSSLSLAARARNSGLDFLLAGLEMREIALDEGHEMFISVIVAHELRFGARLSGRDIEVRTAEALLRRFSIEPFTEADAEGATQVRLGLERLGR